MSEKSFAFNYDPSVGNEYDQREFSAMFNHGFMDGISYKVYGEGSLRVTVPNFGTVRVAPGVFRGQGYCYENDDALILPITPSYTTGTVRTDRVVVRLNTAGGAFGIHTVIKAGTDGSTAAPALTRSGTVYEWSLGQIKYNGSSTTLTAIDERGNSAVCGDFGAEPPGGPTPGPVTDLSSEALSNGALNIKWNNPASENWAKTVLVRRASPGVSINFPKTPADGTVVIENRSKDVGPGAFDADLTPGVTYYYSLFTINHSGNWSIDDAVGFTYKPSAGSWTNLDLINGFTLYNSGGYCKIRRTGGMVELRGIISPPAGNSLGLSNTVAFCDIPEDLRPMNTIYVVCQGGGTNIWTLGVGATATCSRYRSGSTTSNPEITAWMPFSVTWSIE